MGTQGTGRKRSTKKERSTAEDDALNLIAREAEARLAAKRAARAEAREIRMKELERQQKEIFQVQKKYYGLNTKLDDRSDSKWGDIEQWMEDSERYSRSSVIHTLSDEDERMSVGSRGSVRSDLDAVGAYAGGGSSSSSSKKSKKKKKHKHKDRDRNGCDDDYSTISSRSSRLSDESSRVSRSSRLDLTSSRLSDDSRLTRASRLDLQPASYASSDLYKLNGLSSSRNPASSFNGYQSSLYEDSLCSGSRRVAGSTSHPLEYSSYRSSGSRISSRASSARTSPVDSVLRSAAGSSGLTRDLDDVTIPDFSDGEDRDYLEKGSRAASALTAGTLTSLGGTSSRRGSGETAITVDAETSLREIKEIHELKDQIQDVETKYTQNLKEVKETLAEVEEKYRKAMVSNAQLDNEKNNLMYQVDTLKDSLMELEELLSESRRGFDEKVKDFEREKHAHSVLQFQFNEMKETLKQSEELLNEIRQLRMKQEGFVREISDLQETVEWKDKKIGALERQKEYTDAIRIERDELREEVVTLKDILKKHGIVLGPDLAVNGETQVDGSPSEEPASPSAQDSQTSAEGNSMLGSTKETQLRTRGDEEADLEQRQEMFEEVEVNQKKKQNVDIKVKETKTTTAGDKTSNQDSRVTGGDTLDEQKNKTNNVEECTLTRTETCSQKDFKEENCPDESVAALSNSEPQQEQDDTKKVDNDEEEEMPSNSPAQGAAAASSGKKKKKKRKGKKKAAPNEDNNQPKEKGKTEKGMQSATKDNGNINARFCCWPVTETLKELKGNQVKNKQKNKDVAGALVVKPVQAVHSNDILKESQMEPVADEQSKEATLEPEKLKEVEALASCESIEAPQAFRDQATSDEKNEQQSLETTTAETFPQADTLQETEADLDKESEADPVKESETDPVKESETDPVKESETDPVKESETDPEMNEQGEEQKLEDEKEEMRSITRPVPESNSSTPPDTRDNSSDAEISEDDAKDCTPSVENREMDKVTETENIEVKEVGTSETIEATAVHDTDGNTDQHLESEKVNAAEAVETFSPEEYPSEESKTGSIQDEDDMEQTLETSEVEEESTFNPGSETSFSASDLEDSINAESIEYPAKRCTSSVDNSDVDFSTNSSVIHTESECVDSAESEVGSVNEIKSETNEEENSEGGARVPDHRDVAPDESESPNSPDSGSFVYSTSTDGLYDGQYDGQQSLSGSEQPSELLSETADLDSCSDHTPIDVSERDSEDETQTVVEYEGPDTEAESPRPTLDAGPSELMTDGTEEEELNGDSGEAEGLVEADISVNDQIIDAPDTEESPSEGAAQSEGLDDEQHKTSQCDEQTDEPHAELSREMEENDTVDTLDSPDSPKEGSDISSSFKADQNTEESVEDEDQTNSDDEQSETNVCPVTEQRHEPLKDKSEDYQRSEVSSELTLLDSDDEGDVDEEGQSFDFDDLEMEDAIAMNLTEDPKQISIVEGVEILSKESHKGSLELSQSNVDLIENTDLAEGGHRVDKRHEESDAVSQDTQNSWVHGDASSENLVEEQANIMEEVGVTEEPRRAAEKGKVLNAAESTFVSEKLNQAMSLPLEEGLDAVQHELKEEDSVSLKSWDLVSSNTESVQTGKNTRKGSKKGKGKGKEDCKMS